MGSIFDDRRRALEESFFARQNAELLEKLRHEAGHHSSRKELSEASGITDKELLDQLLELDIDPETLAALSLIPLLLVAWSDGSVEPAERDAILEAAEKSGIRPGTPGHDLLENWLKTPLDARLKAVWKDYISALLVGRSPEFRTTLRHELIGRARSVAKAAGGFLGLGNRISKEEERALGELESAFL